MLRHTRRHWRGLGLREKLKLGLCEIWYGLYAVHLLMAALFPVVALSLNEPWVDVELLDFFAHVAPVSVVALIIAAWVRAQGWLRPRWVPLLSWESVLFLFTRWPRGAVGSHSGLGRLAGGPKAELRRHPQR